jgi:hypothetical protein
MEKKQFECLSYEEDILQYMVDFFPLPMKVHSIALVSKKFHEFVFLRCTNLELNSSKIKVKMIFLNEIIPFISNKFSKEGYSSIQNLNISEMNKSLNLQETKNLLQLCPNLRTLKYEKMKQFHEVFIKNQLHCLRGTQCEINPE